MKVLYTINDKLEEELKRICKKEEMSMTDVEAIYKMVDIIKDITTIDAMLNSNLDGYSRTHMDEYPNTYSYNSGARVRDMRGRYSGHGNEEIDRLRSMARNARSEDERQYYMDMADRLSM